VQSAQHLLTFAPGPGIDDNHPEGHLSPLGLLADELDEGGAGKRQQHIAIGDFLLQESADCLGSLPDLIFNVSIDEMAEELL